MIEIVTALLAFLSISVFLVHAFDAYRTDWSHGPKPPQPSRGGGV
jgi:hypothetical protein